MWSINSSVKSDNYGLENTFQFNKVLDYNFDLRKLQFERFKRFMGNLYRNMYNNNQSLIVHELEQICMRFTHVSLDCNFLSCIMSSLVNYYLISCSLKSQRYLSIAEKENVFNFSVTFKKSLFSKLSKTLKAECLFGHIPEIIFDNSVSMLKELSIGQPVQVYDGNIKAAVVGKTKMPEMVYNLSNDNEFRAFASILDQDYTKSSKGYAGRKYNLRKSEDIDNDNSNSYDLSLSACYEETNESCSCESKQVINKSSFKSLQITSDVLTDNEIIYGGEDSSNSDVLSVSTSDEDSCDYIDSASSNIISRYFSTLENGYCKSRPFDSDSEDSIVFSEDPSNIKTGLYDSDSEDSFIFSESSSITKDRFIIFCDEDDSNISFAYTNKFDCGYSTSCLNSIDYKSYYPDSKEHDLLSSDDESGEDLNCVQIGYGRSSDISSLSQQRIFTSSLQLNFSGQGFENPCFEDDTKLNQYQKIKMVNDDWKVSMADVSDEPRIAKKVSFVPDPELVAVQIFETEEDNSPSYISDVLDKIRFKNRIKKFEVIMAPFLTVEHRTNILQRSV